MCIKFIAFGITHFERSPSIHYNCLTTRILLFYSVTILEPTSNGSAQDPLSNVTLEDTIRSRNSEIFNKFGHLGNISEAQHINKMREHFNKLEKIAVKSVKSTKYAICSINEVTNRLGSISVSSSNTKIQVSAINIVYVAIRSIHSKIHPL
jgi:hypothetical protein